MQTAQPLAEMTTMWLEEGGQQMVDGFWTKAGFLEPFPRDLERPLALSLPIALVRLPKLELRDIEAWLLKRGVRFTFGCRSRAVRGCLLAKGGRGIIFVDGSDPDDECRFTLAHEIAHFLSDYEHPRARALESFGNRILQVLDGSQNPSFEDRFHGLLAGASLRLYQNLADRNAGGEGDLNETWRIETRADRMAMAILAPPEAVLESVELSRACYSDRRDRVTKSLVGEFGLPLRVAEGYAGRLLAELGLGRSWVDSLRDR